MAAYKSAQTRDFLKDTSDAPPVGSYNQDYNGFLSKNKSSAAPNNFTISQSKVHSPYIHQVKARQQARLPMHVTGSKSSNPTIFV